MRRRVLLCLTLITMSACNGDQVVQPTAIPTSPTNAISDATHSAAGFASNPDFFFLPPMVKNASGSPAWNDGAFNANLHPTVEICASAATTEAAIASATCTPVPPALSATVNVADELYQVNWKVPSSSVVFFRIAVKVGTKTLGFADVAAGANAAEVKNLGSGEYIPLVDGRTLPIKFRIERYALCEDPLAGGCTSASGDLAVAPLTVSTGTPDESGISTATGVTIPQQEGGSLPVTVTLATCADLSAVLHRETIGDCLRVNVDGLNLPLVNPATVFICSVGVGAYGLTDADKYAVTMYRYDDNGVAALPHTDACKPNTPGGVVASAAPTLSGMLASVAHGQFRRAAREAAALLAPKPLYAAMFIDLGGGGLTFDFSDFQFARPSVLIYGPSLFTNLPGTPAQNEAQLAEAAGMAVTVWDAATWATKSSADFARYSAIVFADPNCGVGTTSLATANGTKAQWSPDVDGPAVVIGTDPVLHRSEPEALALMSNALKFVTKDPGVTGLYVALSCYYALTSTATPVDFLSVVGSFSVQGEFGLTQTVVIDSASHPVMAGLTNTGLSNWDVSVHEAFPTLASYPAEFRKLASVQLAGTETPAYRAYIIARDRAAPTPPIY